jgi:hypothetical protein
MVSAFRQQIKPQIRSLRGPRRSVAQGFSADLSNI